MGPLQDPVTWYGINYTGTQMTQWDFQNKGKSGWTGKSSFVLKVPLRHLRPSVIYSVPCDWILQGAYPVHQQTGFLIGQGNNSWAMIKSSRFRISHTFLNHGGLERSSKESVIILGFQGENDRFKGRTGKGFVQIQ